MFPCNRTEQTGVENGIFHIKGSIAAGLTLVILLATTTAFAQSGAIDPLEGNIDADVDSAESIKPHNSAGDPVAGKEKSELCQGCHGEHGVSTEPLIPKLAGQYSSYISKQVHDYQVGNRTHRIMSAVAPLVDDDDLDDIAAYFASQKKMKGDGSEDNPLGKELFLHGNNSRPRFACVSCHGVKGKGLAGGHSMIPVLGGQHMDYIRRQLLNFRKGDRTNAKIMNRIAGSLTDTEIKSLAEYISVQ